MHWTKIKYYRDGGRILIVNLIVKIWTKLYKTSDERILSETYSNKIIRGNSERKS